jgi:hypothetical protein
VSAVCPAKANWLSSQSRLRGQNSLGIRIMAVTVIVSVCHTQQGNNRTEVTMHHNVKASALG